VSASADARVVVVTGGASGLGDAVVACLRERGDTPVVLDVRPPRDGVEHVAVDLADGRAAEEAVRRVAGERGALHGVVCAAGIDACGPLDGVAADDWERVIAVNLVGTAAVVRAALPYLERVSGRVVMVASTLGLRAVGDATAYCASKFGVVGFTRALAAETAGRVGVTLLVPGGMRTAFFDGREERYRPSDDADLNDPAHVADAVVFALAQPEGCEVRELLIAPAREGSWP
jgi:NAD(P)-dependent dehydrogenase (short-subunit alcohol dehydrogenase family)